MHDSILCNRFYDIHLYESISKTQFDYAMKFLRLNLILTWSIPYGNCFVFPEM
jgi:hypothetical protein